MILEELSEKLQEIKVKNTFLYFITRVLKPVFKKSSKVMDKYIFKVYQIDVVDEIQKHLHELSQEQLSYLAAKKTELQEYDIITDDTQKLFTYQMTNNAMSFADVVNKQLKSQPPRITSLEEIILNEELWAYCVGFHIKGSEWIYTFRKILSGKVAIDEKEGNKKSVIQKAIRTVFGTKSQKLELIQGETVNLDKQIDCIFYDDIFYIAKKTQFEQIVGLEEEFKEQAKEVLAVLEKTKMIEGLEVLEKQIEDNPSIHRKLVRLSKIGNYSALNTNTISKMQEISRLHNEKLKVKNDKILIEDEKDLSIVVKLLCDYYKKGEVSGKSYGTFAGEKLD
ncbi:MAG: DUF4868 domain-containing protein [Chloroherpetonaceae bacterium]|nr:DUF4868 domain-containing protein [Chloroherpetonaceae bacterium]